MVVPDKKSRVKAVKRPKTRRSSQLVDDDVGEGKIRKKEGTSQLVGPPAVSDRPLVAACGC